MSQTPFSVHPERPLWVESGYSTVVTMGLPLDDEGASLPQFGSMKAVVKWPRMTAFDGRLNRSTQHPRLLQADVDVSGFRAAWLDRDPILLKHD